MTGRGVVVWMASVVLAASFGVAGARGTRDLTESDLRSEMTRNGTLAAYVDRNGLPDVAETRFLADQPPWDDHEVVLYYLDMRKEIAFARAWVLGRPNLSFERYSRQLTDDQIAALSERTRLAASGTAIGPVARAEEAARRAEEAAGRVEEAANAAEHAAGRTEAMVGKVEDSFGRALRK